MHSCHSIMCFSSCIICLLIVAGHGSPIPGHDGVVNGIPTSRENTTHQYDRISTDLKRISNSSQYHKNSVKNNSHNERNDTHNFIVSPKVIFRKSRDTLRKEKTNEMSLPLPPHMDSQSLHNSSRLTYNDCNVKNQSSSSLPESSKQLGHPHHNEYHNSHDSEDHHQHDPSNKINISGHVWLYSSIAVIVVSLCGLLSVAIIPIMQKWFYHTLLQFLVGLAVGSLSGDGLLHLMPHAILEDVDIHDHDGNHSIHFDPPSGKEMQNTAIWRGLAALGGIFLFFIAERLLGAITLYRRQNLEAKFSRHSKKILPVMQQEESANNGNVGQKLAQPKKNSYDHIQEKDEKETIQMLQTEASSPIRKGSAQSTHEVGFHGRSSFSIDPDMSVTCRPDSESSVVVSEHHGHNHGHSHDIPHSVSAVAWMVIMGDGFHNFCDGLAIGAAFASSDTDGISTSVAVFCHELPHELGDFAMLLKTGMKVKQALFYNGLSSILCFIGMIIGVLLGNVKSAKSWVFSGTVGMFLYIALVDMLPELTNGNKSGLSSFVTLAVQVVGISMGISIMLLIALFDHELHSIVS